ncbi:MAG: ferredoxin [Sedimentisphaerales bacterium]|nr:ferredoxin [Sedimentisphaerales bacterium]
MQAEVNADACTGCGLCVSLCEDVFEMDGDIAVVQLNPIPENLAAAVRDAAESCPVEAISVIET